MQADSILSGRVVRRRLLVLDGPPGPDAPREKRLRLPQGELAQILNGEPAARYLAWVELRPGRARGNHYHRTKLEHYYQIVGESEWVFEDPSTRERASLSLEAGDLLIIPPGIAHALRPTSAGHAIEFAPEPLDLSDTHPYPLT